MVHGNSVGTVSPLAITDMARAWSDDPRSKAIDEFHGQTRSGRTAPRSDLRRMLPTIFRFGLPCSGTTFSPCRRIPSFPSTFPESPR